MKFNELKPHLIDLIKGAIGAAVTAALLALLQYMGTHIPEIIQLLSMTAGGMGAVKIRLV